MTGTDRETALKEVRRWVDRARGMSGWDLTSLPAVDVEPGPPWSYAAVVRECAEGARRVLDVGTGGGEVLSGLRDALPSEVVATEEWGPNAPVARRRLMPLRVEVVRCAAEVGLPFAKESFDLVIARHEAISPREVARVLASGGQLVTQQVGYDDLEELREFFPRMRRWDDHGSVYQAKLKSLGFEVELRRHWRKVAMELGPLAYLITVSPWSIADFDAERDLEALVALEAAYGSERGVVLTESRYLLRAG